MPAIFPTSTHKGQAVLGFPDVCRTPSTVGAPVPIAFPNMGTTAARMRTKSATKTTPTGTAYKTTSGDVAGLRSHLSVLHGKLMTMPAGNTTGWHKVLDDYVLTSAEVYKSLSSR